MSQKKVLVTSRSFGRISREPFEILENAGFVVNKLEEGFKFDVFEKEVMDCDALIIGAHKFPKELMAKCSKLKIICKHGAGLDNIDLDAAKELGIVVCNAPGTNSNAVADLVFGLILNAARKISIANNRVKDGMWKTITGIDVYEKTIGILGFGAIGRCVARRAHGFDMKVKVYDPFLKEIPGEFNNYVELCDKENLLKQSNIVTVHMPLNKETEGMISGPEFELMPKDAIVINTARGGIIDEKMLCKYIENGHVFGAGIDVTVHEPVEEGSELLKYENITITPHMGMYSREAIGAVGLICAKNIVRFDQGEELQFRVV